MLFEYWKYLYTIFLERNIVTLLIHTKYKYLFLKNWLKFFLMNQIKSPTFDGGWHHRSFRPSPPQSPCKKNVTFDFQRWSLWKLCILIFLFYNAWAFESLSQLDDKVVLTFLVSLALVVAGKGRLARFLAALVRLDLRSRLRNIQWPYIYQMK